jgi:branched-chain amino acid aminotransferase
MSRVWLNGTLADKTEPRLNVFDHGFLYGDGVWEHFRLYHGKPAHAEHHFRILATAANALRIDIPLSQEQLLAAIEHTANANNRTEGYVRVIVSRGPGTIGADPRKIEPQVIVIAEEYQPFPHELYGHGLHAVFAPQPLREDNPAHRYRTLNQLHAVHAKQFALSHGCFEAIYQTPDGDCVGTTEGTLFVVKDRSLIVPAGQPEDVTAFAVSTVAANSGMAVAEHAVNRAELLAASEVFVAGTACGIIGLVRIAGQEIGSGTEGPTTATLRTAYNQHVRSEIR